MIQTWIFAANTYGRVAARLARLPVVVTAEMAVDLWKSPRELAIDRWLAQRTDRVVGNSQAVVDFYRRAGIPAERLALIRSGIGAEEPPPVDRAAVRASFGWPADTPLLVFAGRLAAQKGVDDLIAAIDLVQYLLPALRVLIVGDGPLRAQLEATAAAFRLGGIVRFTGHRDDVPQLLAAADLLVLPSLYEGLPNIVLEAMRFGPAGRRHRRAGDDRGRRRRPDRAARPAPRPPRTGAGDPDRRGGPRARPPLGRRRREPASSPSSAPQP